MKKLIWEVKYLSLPPILKYCKKCGKKKTFICSGQFRVNAQRKYLDIWLIYKCSDCDTTWNAAIYSRISPQALEPELLEGFFKNDEFLVKRYAMDSAFLRANDAKAGMPLYSVIGDNFLIDECIELEIKSSYSFPIKVSSLVREKLHLSQKKYLQLISEGRVSSVPEQDLRKLKLKDGIILIFQ